MSKVFVIQDIPGTKAGAPKINIIGATQFGQLKVLLPENSQIILSPTYVPLAFFPHFRQDIDFRSFHPGSSNLNLVIIFSKAYRVTEQLIWV